MRKGLFPFSDEWEGEICAVSCLVMLGCHEEEFFAEEQSGPEGKLKASE